MYYPSLKEFLKLSNSSNVIPVYKEINADLDTPVSAFLKIKKDDYSFLFESVEGQENVARYSFLGTKPYLIFRSKGKNIELILPYIKSVREYVTASDPLDEIKKIMADFKPAHIKGLPPFCGGMVGFMSYDAVRFFENIPDKNPDDLKLAELIFMLTDTILIFDHINHSIKIVVNVLLPKNGNKISKIASVREKTRFYNAALTKITKIQDDFNNPIPKQPLGNNGPCFSRKKLISNYKKADFQNLIKKSKSYIKNGDIIQVVLSQRFKIEIDKPPFNIYRNLRSINPSPYMFFLNLKEVILIGSSPEILVRCQDGAVEARPIAGTRPRGKTPEDDLKMENELLNDAKEKAEHIMLVDLGRNDIGRVCKPGSVQIKDFMSVEKYSHVMHLVTQVKGILKEGFDVFDVLRASFPAGTVSGSPKIRAMEIIDSLENSKRGPYAGCVGYFSFSQNMDTCITIRTIIVKDGIAYVQAGAGIVADSVPSREYLETVNKAKALIEAIIK